MLQQHFTRLLQFTKDNLLLLSCIIMLVPFLLLCKFIHPYADDYTFAAIANELGFWNAQKELFHRVNGRFVTNMVQSFDILHGQYAFLYNIFPIISIFLQISSIYLLVKEVLEIKKFNINIRFALTLFCIYIVQMSLVSEGLYWWSTTANYQLANIFGTLLLISIIRIIRKKRLIINTCFASILSILLVGTSETTFLLLAVTIGLITLVNSISLKKIHINLLVVTLSFFVAIVIPFVSASSNRINNPSSVLTFLKSIIMSLFQYGMSFIGWSGLIILFIVLLFQEIKHLTNFQKNIIFKANPYLVFYILSLAIITAFFSGFITSGVPLPPRARHTVNFFFILGFSYFLLTLFNNTTIASNLTLNKNLRLILLVIGCSLLLGSNNNINAIKDLGKKRALLYDTAMQERTKIVSKAPFNSRVVLKPLSFKNFPVTICPRDLDRSDIHYVYNYWYSIYWKLDGVTLECD